MCIQSQSFTTHQTNNVEEGRTVHTHEDQKNGDCNLSADALQMQEWNKHELFLFFSYVGQMPCQKWWASCAPCNQQNCRNDEMLAGMCNLVQNDRQLTICETVENIFLRLMWGHLNHRFGNDVCQIKLSIALAQQFPVTSDGNISLPSALDARSTVTCYLDSVPPWQEYPQKVRILLCCGLKNRPV
jgi:hypothetical protein